VSKALAFGYNNDVTKIAQGGVGMDRVTYKPPNKGGAATGLLQETINKFTFYYDPEEITIDAATRKFLEDFRTDDGEDCFVLTRDDEGFVIY